MSKTKSHYIGQNARQNLEKTAREIRKKARGPIVTKKVPKSVRKKENVPLKEKKEKIARKHEKFPYRFQK